MAIISATGAGRGPQPAANSAIRHISQGSACFDLSISLATAMVCDAMTQDAATDRPIIMPGPLVTHSVTLARPLKESSTLKECSVLTSDAQPGCSSSPRSQSWRGCIRHTCHSRCLTTGADVAGAHTRRSTGHVGASCRPGLGVGDLGSSGTSRAVCRSCNTGTILLVWAIRLVSQAVSSTLEVAWLWIKPQAPVL